MLELGVDEITLVLQINHNLLVNFDPLDWKYYANELINEFEEKAEFISIFGNRERTYKSISGYTTVLEYVEHNFFIVIAYHEMHLRMGILVKFSAQAFHYYCDKMQINTYRFIQKIQSKYYTTRLSRIDLVADYIDENVSVNSIYQGFIDNNIGVFKEQPNKKKKENSYRKINLKYRGFIKGKEVPTLYIGSNKNNSNLRIYNKREEQIARKGTNLEKALQCKNWVRFEAVFRNEYAHQITDKLINIKTDEDYANLIACTIYQKFRFMYMENGVADCDVEYTRMIADAITNKQFILFSKSTKNYELIKNIEYLFYGSGILATIYKIEEIWGIEAVDYLFDAIKKHLETIYEPNDECKLWLRKNQSGYINMHQDFEAFLNNIYQN